MTGRAYRGLSAEQRLADRRERLMMAAYTLFANPGFPATTIERLCTMARVSNRAFYECFSGREALMQAVYDRCVDETLQAVAKAMAGAPNSLDARIEHGVAEYVAFVTRDPRRAHIMHVEVRRAGDCLITARQRAVGGFSRVMEEAAAAYPTRTPPNTHLLVLALIGALQELLIEWVLAEDPPSADDLVATAVHIFRRSFNAGEATDER
ncbi:TetR/AcrR family transcriptional regulator [Spongiactinospora sp. TRM90649]|uniref:TetR/AcrR family transcriptional regulator n=1 Tax=Spongiactinospora sp. TRM90649 TaxID=3031114 RepID=UPI0023F8EA21|nr:TetR/AcrR family transcriptional regulator [Spongiactinospora sp. TRM90649]MDF5752560.1 TetR/AcrR family transcriptional regulator [Spongiactinospora sp. TRM90649]